MSSEPSLNFVHKRRWNKLCTIHIVCKDESMPKIALRYPRKWYSSTYYNISRQTSVIEVCCCRDCGAKLSLVRRELSIYLKEQSLLIKWYPCELLQVWEVKYNTSSYANDLRIISWVFKEESNIKIISKKSYIVSTSSLWKELFFKFCHFNFVTLWEKFFICYLQLHIFFMFQSKFYFLGPKIEAGNCFYKNFWCQK